jgi:hypothetical protein
MSSPINCWAVPEKTSFKTSASEILLCREFSKSTSGMCFVKISFMWLEILQVNIRHVFCQDFLHAAGKRCRKVLRPKTRMVKIGHHLDEVCPEMGPKCGLVMVKIHECAPIQQKQMRRSRGMDKRVQEPGDDATH